jgi:hypothetical protein
MEFAFRYDGPSAALLKVLGLGPRFSSLRVTDDTLHVKLGWGFRATIPRTSIRSATPDTSRPISRGAHGWRGRWLVNGSGKGLVTITVEPHARAYTIGFPLRLRQLTVSVEAPSELIEALTAG